MNMECVDKRVNLTCFLRCSYSIKDARLFVPIVLFMFLVDFKRLAIFYKFRFFVQRNLWQHP